MLNHLLLVLACFGHYFSAEARLIRNQSVARTVDQQIRDHLGTVSKVTQCKYSPDEVVEIGLGAAKPVNAKASLSKIDNFSFDVKLYKVSQTFTKSCSITVVPDSPPPTPSAYVLYICGGNLWSTEYNCSFLEGDGGCPYTQTGPFIDWDWNGDWSAMGCLD